MSLGSCATFSLVSSCGNTFWFPYPEYGQPDNKIRKNIRLFNMWLHNDIETEDEGIDNQPLILGGTICSEYTNPESGGVCMPVCPGNICFGVTDPGGYTIDDMLAQLKEDMNKGCTFTISGLGECLNGVYVITSFKLNTIRRSANCFHWEFQLERVEDI